MKGVKYIAAVYDRSGYSEAARNYVMALHMAGIPVKLEPISFEHKPPPLENEEMVRVFKSLTENTIEYDVVIVHTTPDILVQYANQNPGKYIINMTVWETSKIHPHWVKACNEAHEIWLPAKWNCEVFRNSGVTKPVTYAPHGLKSNLFDGIGPNDLQIPGFSRNNRYIFYSIFQWHYRKNPIGLLRSFFRAFDQGEDVALVVKTYTGNMQYDQERTFILDEIQKIRDASAMVKYPEVFVINKPMTNHEMLQLYAYGDCYVSLHRGEGFGLTLAAAGLAGKPVVATGATGNMEFMTTENSYPVAFSWTKVSSMRSFNPWYLESQAWTEPNIMDAANKMRYIYAHQEEARQRGQLLSENIKTNFSLEKIAEPMVNRLRELNAL